MLENSDPMPLYHKLYQLLHQAIHSGAFATGAKLPTEKQLQEETGMSRVTIKRALDELALEGLVVRRRGIGTLVQYAPSPLQATHAPLRGLLENLEEMGRNTQVKVLQIKYQTPPEGIAAQFKISPEDTLLHIIRRRNFQNGGRSFAYYQSWTRIKNFPAKVTPFRSKPRLQLLREAGLVFGEIHQRLGAQAADSNTARELQLPLGHPLLTLTRSSYDRRSVLCDLLIAHYNPELFEYQMELRRE
ncbi:MAG: GntR family transcriptional regulator [Gammaproteobacteria bacterium AqS3]|nr:GntR family transcriptional regulator [Gammaproteobacteria bacterium AqS3]